MTHKYDIASNPSTPPATLAILATDADGRVRWGVANNPKKQT